MKTSQLTALALTSLAGFANAATLVQYHDGTTSTTAYNVAAGITGSGLSYAGNGADTFRTSFGGAGATPAGPTAGTASGSNWRLWRKSNITEALSASDNYAGFTINIGAAADGITLGDLTFDLAGGGANSATGGIDVNYQAFAQVNGGGFSAVGSPSGFIQLLADATINSFSPVVTGTVDLSSLGALSAGDTVDIRISVQSEDGVGSTNIGLFMQGIKLVDAVPEPGSLVLVGIGGLFIISRRRRA
jgi:hypothetical protein